MDLDRLRGQLDFIYESDKVKQIIRKTKLFDGSRFENDAEHSWSACLMAGLLREYAEPGLDIARAQAMLLVHDLVEIDAGDTLHYAKQAADVSEKEERAAKRIFGLLPADQADGYYALWSEFEKRETKEAKFAAVLDRLEPILQNYRTECFTWREHGITKAMVIEKNRHIAEGSPEIWAFVLSILSECEEKGWLPS